MGAVHSGELKFEARREPDVRTSTLTTNPAGRLNARCLFSSLGRALLRCGYGFMTTARLASRLAIQFGA
jgi:hypothetical protein